MNKGQRNAEPPREQIDRLVALYDGARYEEALRHGDALERQFPNVPFVAYLLGCVNAAAGRLEEAVASYTRALQIEPGSAVTHFNLGIALEQLGRTREAVASYTQALKIRPDPKAYNNLGACLQDLGMSEAAAASYRRALEIEPDLAEAHNNLGYSLDRLLQPAAAVVSLRRALEIRPEYAEAHNNLGNALMHLGESDQAIASYEAGLAIRPGYAEAHRNLSALKEYRRDDPQIAQMLRLAGQSDLPDEDRMLLGFALGKAYGDIGEHDRAFDYLALANRLRKAELGYDISPTRAAFERVASMFTQVGPSLTLADETETASTRTPVFVLGMPRSGTTLVEQILASHSSVYGAGELRLLDQSVLTNGWDSAPLSLDRLRAVRRSYLEKLVRIGGQEPFVTDKMPFNFLWLGFVLTALPQAKVIHVERDARATCWSNFKHYFADKRTGFTNDLRDLAEYYKMYAELMKFWHQRFPGRIYDLRYEALVGDQENQTRKLLDYIGLEWEAQCLEFHATRRAVNTASASQVRRRMYQGSSDEWRNYRRHLEPLIEALEGY